MEIFANGVRIRLEPLDVVTDEDWVRVNVDVSDSGFTASFVAWLQSQDVERFATDLASLHANLGLPGKAILQCHEPGIYLELHSDTAGHIDGRYEFTNETAAGFSPSLCGKIDMDQSFLPIWEKACRQFIVAVRR